MRIVTARELESWLASGKVLEQDARGPKVVDLQNGLFLKIFYTRKTPFIARLRPPAARFSQNCQELIRRGIHAPVVEETLWLNRAKGLSACLYRPLPGRSLDRLSEEERFSDANLNLLASFILELHQKGIYFRSLHLGNILETNEREFGLIDVLDLQLRRDPLSKWYVQRNFDHLRNSMARRNIDFPLDILLARYQALVQAAQRG